MIAFTVRSVDASPGGQFVTLTMESGEMLWGSVGHPLFDRATVGSVVEVDVPPPDSWTRIAVDGVPLDQP